MKNSQGKEVKPGGKYRADRPMVRKARGTKADPQPAVEPKFRTTKKSRAGQKQSPNSGRRTGYAKGQKIAAPTPKTRKRPNAPICGAPKTGRSTSGEGPCCNPAGARTPHLGTGHCWLHGGNTPPHVQKGEIEKAKRAVLIFGLPKEIDPHRALMEELWFTAGHVEWLREEIIQKMDDKAELRQVTDAGVEPSVWIAMYQSEREHLVKVAKACIDAGVQERQVRLQEEQGRLLAMVIQAFVRDPELALTPTQLVAAPKLIRKHLGSVPMAIGPAEMPPDLPGAAPLPKVGKATDPTPLVMDVISRERK